MSTAAARADFSATAGTWIGAWVGTHALLLYLVMLTLSIGTTALVGRRLQAQPALDERRRLGIALGVMGAGSALLGVLALQLEPGSALTRFDLAVSGAVLQQVPQAVVGFFAVLTHIGDTATGIGLALVVGAALLWRRQRFLAFGFVGGLAGNAALTSGLKHLLGRARPLQPPGGVTVHGYSFPSGHSAGSVVACGLLAYLALRLLPRRWHLAALCAAVGLSLTIGTSRIFVRAHFPSDVLAGFTSGAVWLAAWVLLLESLRMWLERSRKLGRMPP